MFRCRVCNSENKPFISFGQMPIANGFLTKEEFSEEYFFEMEAAFCENCGMFQLVQQPEAELMFHEEYAFFSSLSKNMQSHFKEFSELVMKEYIFDKEDPLVVELGSNDGIMLKNFSLACCTKQYPGSLIRGVPASDTNATFLPSDNCWRILGVFFISLCSFSDWMLPLMPK